MHTQTQTEKDKRSVLEHLDMEIEVLFTLNNEEALSDSDTRDCCLWSPAPSFSKTHKK